MEALASVRQNSHDSSDSLVQSHRSSVPSHLGAKEIASDLAPPPLIDPNPIDEAHAKRKVPLAQHSQSAMGADSPINMGAMVKDPTLHEIIKEEMPFKSKDSFLKYAQQKMGQLSMKDMAQSAMDSAVAKIPVIGKTAAFLAERDTGNSMRLTALSHNADANPLAREMVESLTGGSMNKQTKTVISAAVKHFSSVATHYIPGADTFASGLAAQAIDKGISGAEALAKKGMVYGLHHLAKQGNEDVTPMLAQQEMELSNGKSVKLSSQTALYCLMKYLATPPLTQGDSQKLGMSMQDLTEAQLAKKQLIEELGGYADMNSPKNPVDKGVNDVLLYLMTNPKKAGAFQLLVDVANSGQEPSMSQVQRFAALTKSTNIPTGMDLRALLANPQVKSETGHGFNYHNAMLLASGIEKSDTFKYSFHEGRALSSLYKDSPRYEPQDAKMRHHEVIVEEDELSLHTLETLKKARQEVELETTTMNIRGKQVEVQLEGGFD